MITYMDRVVLSTTLPLIQKELDLDTVTRSWVQAAFRFGYALFQIPGGWLGDSIGPRKALTLIVIWWSVFTSLTAAAWNTWSMIVFRFLFGVGEAGAFPTATRSLSRWMLPTERGYAQGVTHAGSRLGAALTPPLVALIMTAYGWKLPFVLFGAMGVAWAVFWYIYYRDDPDEHRSVNSAERELIHSSIGSSKTKKRTAVPWRRILASPTLWVLSSMYFCYGWCLAVYLDWLPTYLNEHREMDLRRMGFFAALPLLAGTLGDFLGGWLSDRIGERTGNLAFARRSVAITGFLAAAAGIIPATFAESAEACVAWSCLAVFGIEFTVGVSWAIPLDIGGDFAGSVSAVMNTFGNVGGTISTFLLGYLVKGYGWNVPFLVAACMCIMAAVLFTRIDATRKIRWE
jgi:MFS family permease